MAPLMVLGAFLVLPSSGVRADEDEVEVLVVYFSAEGHTRAMAAAVQLGASSVDGVSVKLLALQDAEVSDVLEADAILVGSPVYNANVAPQVQSFINSWPFRGAPLRDKIGAAFVSGGGISAGEETVQLGILRSMLVFGMIVVGGPDWRSAFGASAVTDEEPFASASEDERVESRFLAKGRALGKRVAELAVRLHATRREQAAQGGP